MTVFFVQQTPFILTDALFVAYGGVVANSTPEQRQAAYVIAEQAVQADLETFLTPTTVTGSYRYDGNTLLLDHGYINSVSMVQLVGFDGSVLYSVSGVNNWYVTIQDPGYGLIELSRGFISHHPLPYSVNVVYEAGFASGTVYTPNMLAALTSMATIELNEIIGYGNESTGDVGVQEFNNQDYHEKRVRMIRTAFGSSAKAQRIHRLLSPYRLYRHPGMGRPVR